MEIADWSDEHLLTNHSSPFSIAAVWLVHVAKGGLIFPKRPNFFVKVEKERTVVLSRPENTIKIIITYYSTGGLEGTGLEGTISIFLENFTTGLEGTVRKFKIVLLIIVSFLKNSAKTELDRNERSL